MQELVIDSSKNLNTLYRHLGFKLSNTKEVITKIVLSKKNSCENIKKIALWLHKELMYPVMEELFEENFDYLLDYEEKDIRKRMPEVLRKNETALAQLLLPKLLGFAEDFSHINLEGFSIFCIKEYKDAFLVLMEECIDNYLAEQDYYDFLEILRIYVETKEPRCKTILIVISKKGEFCTMDKNTMEIYGEQYVQPEDALLHVLLDLIPERIIIYGIERLKNQNIIRTLEYIFQSRITCMPADESKRKK